MWNTAVVEESCTRLCKRVYMDPALLLQEPLVVRAYSNYLTILDLTLDYDPTWADLNHMRNMSDQAQSPADFDGATAPGTASTFFPG
jgi:hypothetical protein